MYSKNSKCIKFSYLLGNAAQTINFVGFQINNNFLRIERIITVKSGIYIHLLFKKNLIHILGVISIQSYEYTIFNIRATLSAYV